MCVRERECVCVRERVCVCERERVCVVCRYVAGSIVLLSVNM